MNEKLQEINNMLPLMKEITGVDALITVWDHEARVEGMFCGNNANPNITIGDQVTDSKEPLIITLRTGKPSYNAVPKKAYGIELEGSIIPIKQNGEVIGAVTYCFSTQEKKIF